MLLVNGTENLIFEWNDDNEHIKLTEVMHNQSKIVRYIHNDYRSYDSGFYVATSDNFDDKIKILNT